MRLQFGRQFKILGHPVVISGQPASEQETYKWLTENLPLDGKRLGKRDLTSAETKLPQKALEAFRSIYITGKGQNLPSLDEEEGELAHLMSYILAKLAQSDRQAAKANKHLNLKA